MKISFRRLLEIEGGSPPNQSEVDTLRTRKSVYAITNDKLNLAYIGETTNTWMRLFTFWKVDKRHVSGENAAIFKYFEGDYDNTYFEVLEFNCDHKSRESYWTDYYRHGTLYVVMSHSGRHGCDSPGNKGMIAVHKDGLQSYIMEDDLHKFEELGWKRGGKSNRPRTEEQKKHISEGHIGQVPWNKGTKGEPRPKYRFRLPDGSTKDTPTPNKTKHYHPNWILIGRVDRLPND